MRWNSTGKKLLESEIEFWKGENQIGRPWFWATNCTHLCLTSEADIGGVDFKTFIASNEEKENILTAKIETNFEVWVQSKLIAASIHKYIKRHTQ